MIVFSIKMTLITNFKRINTTFLKRNIIRLASNEAASKQKKEKTTRKKSPSQKSDLFENMQQHAETVASDDYKYLSETFIKRLHQVRTKGDHEILKEGKMSIWSYIMSYQRQYDEKAILVDSLAASKIAKAILYHSDAKCTLSDIQNKRHGIFIDGNGGLCRVTDEIINECNEMKGFHTFNHIFVKVTFTMDNWQF